jgi:hypothetical protein
VKFKFFSCNDAFLFSSFNLISTKAYGLPSHSTLKGYEVRGVGFITDGGGIFVHCIGSIPNQHLEEFEYVLNCSGDSDKKHKWLENTVLTKCHP